MAYSINQKPKIYQAYPPGTVCVINNGNLKKLTGVNSGARCLVINNTEGVLVIVTSCGRVFCANEKSLIDYEINPVRHLRYYSSCAMESVSEIKRFFKEGFFNIAWNIKF